MGKIMTPISTYEQIAELLQTLCERNDMLLNAVTAEMMDDHGKSIYIKIDSEGYELEEEDGTIL